MFSAIKNKKQKRGQRSTGFSLVEILVTVGLVGIMIVVYFGVLNSGFLARDSRDRDVALRIASHKIEELRALGYSNLPASGSFTDTLMSSLPSGSGSFTVSTYNTKTKQVVVTVSWTEPHQGAHPVVLTTLLTQLGSFK